jgi:hypothetical protein
MKKFYSAAICILTSTITFAQGNSAYAPGKEKAPGQPAKQFAPGQEKEPKQSAKPMAPGQQNKSTTFAPNTNRQGNKQSYGKGK